MQVSREQVASCSPSVVSIMTLARRSRRGSIAEVPPALFILFVVIMLPLIDLLGLALAAGAIGLTNYTCMSRAACQPTFDLALSAMSDEATSFQSTGFFKFLNLQPAGGYQNCGIDMWVKADNFRGGTSQTYGPNTPVPPPVDTTTYIYAYMGRSAFRVSPWISFSGVPLLSQIPGLGQPVVLTFDVCKNVETPGVVEGSVANAAGGNVGSAAPPAINNTPMTITPTPAVAGGSDWNYPNLYQLIEAAGQTVVATDVLTVSASNEDFTPTNIVVKPGQYLWFDFRADGEWATSPVPPSPAWGADGYVNQQDIPQNNLKDANGQGFHWGSLVGNLSDMSYQFFVGQRLTQPAPGTGALSLVFNDVSASYMDNPGQVIVRIVLTQ